MNPDQNLASSAAAAIPPGVHEFGPANGTLSVQTGRAGMAARAGHDLRVVAARWSASLEIDPADPSSSRLSATVDASSLEVREGEGGVKPLTDDDRTEIGKNIAEKVLRTSRHRDITFVSTSVEAPHEGRIRVAGDLTIVGVTRPVQFDVTVGTGSDGATLSTAVSVDQPRFGIKPFSALMGTLKVADAVEVHADAILPPS
jgi:polyisoprenoid-binding protein YceI